MQTRAGQHYYCQFAQGARERGRWSSWSSRASKTGNLWLAVGLSDRVVRSKVCAWQLRGRNARGWTQLYRWADRAADLFALPRPVATPDAGRDTVVGRVLTTLRSLSPLALGAAPIAQQIFAGATRTR